MVYQRTMPVPVLSIGTWLYAVVYCALRAALDGVLDSYVRRSLLHVVDLTDLTGFVLKVRGWLRCD